MGAHLLQKRLIWCLEKVGEWLYFNVCFACFCGGLSTNCVTLLYTILFSLFLPFLSLFVSHSLSCRFLTKREQQLMQRRRHAEELLEWRHRLDTEEAEVRRMEKQALAAWEKQQQQPRNRTPLQQRSRESEHSKTSSGQESPTGQGEECEKDIEMES